MAQQKTYRQVQLQIPEDKQVHFTSLVLISFFALLLTTRRYMQFLLNFRTSASYMCNCAVKISPKFLLIENPKNSQPCDDGRGPSLAAQSYFLKLPAPPPPPPPHRLRPFFFSFTASKTAKLNLFHLKVRLRNFYKPAHATSIQITLLLKHRASEWVQKDEKALVMSNF